MGEIVSFKHNANSGDLLSLLPGLKHIYDTIGKKSVIYQRLNCPGDYFGQSHPVKDDKGNQVTMNAKQWSMLKPLLESQEYIDHVEPWEGQEVDINLDLIREGAYSTMGYGSIHRWQWYTWPQLACDLSKPWLSIDASKWDLFDTVIVNFTSRWRNPAITYFFLKEWQDRLIFAGLPEEHKAFCSENKLDFPRLEVKNFLELAECLASCKFFIGGQSMAWNICEAIKKKRVMEVCRGASNCIPYGPDGYDYLHESAAKFYIKKFMNEK